MECICFISTGDEMFSDTYPMKLVNDVLYEVTGKVILKIIILARSPLLGFNDEI